MKKEMLNTIGIVTVIIFFAFMAFISVKQIADGRSSFINRKVLLYKDTVTIIGYGKADRWVLSNGIEVESNKYILINE